ncbi:MAG: alanine racemase [Erysipelotrichaceae bacterium]|nr:alanine racemase [Erysipelotrichaceae bacterium]
MNFYRDTFAEVDLDLLEHNLKCIQDKIKDKKMIAVIKANGYGHGALEIAKEVLRLGCKTLAVSSLDEALTLRSQGITADILVLGYTRPMDASLAMYHNITLTAPSVEWCSRLERMMPEDKLKVHIKVDTGMNRLGMRCVEEVVEAIHILREKRICVDGIFTHYACSDQVEGTFTLKQYQEFASIVKGSNYTFPYIHASNSDATMREVKEDITNAVRVGLVMYGISDFDEDVRPILSLYTRLTHVHKMEEGEGVGYSQTYHSDTPEWIGTVPIGYADGWVRANQGRVCYIEDTACEFVGRICMDQAMIRLDREYPVDTLVELIGPHCPLKRVSDELGTISYEVVCLLTDRVPRVYRRGGKVVGIENPRMRYTIPR